MTTGSNPHRDQVYQQLDSHIHSYFDGHHITQRAASSTRVLERLPRFNLYEIAPGPKQPLWTYITRGAWERIDDDLTSMEFMLLAPEQNDTHLHLLDVLAYYHAEGTGVLGLGHTVPIGYPWLAASACDHILISHSYPYGWEFEHCATSDLTIHLWWALP